MADIYTRMNATAKRLLRPATSAGGFGQGVVILTRESPGVADPDQPWLPVEPVKVSETLRAAVSGVGTKYADGVTILLTDLRIVAAVPAINWRLGGDDNASLSVIIDGRPVTLVRVRGIPEAGIAASVEFICRN